MSGGQGRDFASDNTAPVAPEIMSAIVAANHGPTSSYGADALTERLTELAREVFETELAIFPVPTGTAANGLALAAACPPDGTIWCHETAHILLEECGGPEFQTGGATLVGIPGPSGKIEAGKLATALSGANSGAVSITQATEWGTVYQPREIAAVAGLARDRGLRIHMDGARLANALARLGCTPAEATWRAGVDLLSLGATKNGALAAEAVICFDPALADGFTERRQRAGALLSKMRFLSAQLVAMLEQGRWLSYAAQANAMADRLAAGLTVVPGLRLVQPVEANELFLAMPEPLIVALHSEGFAFHRWLARPGVAEPVVRLVTSFATVPEDVDGIIGAAWRLSAQGLG